MPHHFDNELSTLDSSVTNFSFFFFFQFSNHTGYANGVRGQVLNNEQLAELIEGLKINNLDEKYTHIINGYIGSEGFLKQLKDTVDHLKSKNPKLIFVCDPVMGDTEPGWYVPQSLMPIYRDEILPLADVCVPNQVKFISRKKYQFF